MRSTNNADEHRTKILVVEDAAIVRDPIAASLRLAGYKTLSAANGSDGLQLLRHERPDLVLLDLAMPVMDGVAFLQHLRADPILASTPVIVLSGTPEAETRLALANRGLTAQSVLVKNQFSLHVLLDRVAQHIAKGSAAA